MSASRALRITPNNLDHLGLTPEDLTSPDFTACQHVAEHAAFPGYDVLIVPSARADGINVVVFVDEFSADAVFETVGSEQIA